MLDVLPEQIRDKCEVATITGLRATEIDGSPWTGWSRRRGVPPPWILRVPEWAAKNRKERIVGLTDRGLDVLRRRAADGRDTVFGKGNHARALRLACREVGYHKNITLRDLRHTFGTLALRSTADPWATLQAMGHSDLQGHIDLSIDQPRACSRRPPQRWGTGSKS